MSTMHTQRRTGRTDLGQLRAWAEPRWRHPFDSATGTIALGALLTVALVVALRLLTG